MTLRSDRDPFTTGTFWYHSHLSTQYCDGLRGAMVVYDPEDPHADLYDVDDESTVITLTEWYHTAARLGSAFPCVFLPCNRSIAILTLQQLRW